MTMPYSVAKSKTIFEFLGLPDTATRAEVVTAYQALCKHYESGAHGLSSTLAEYKLATLKAAMETYSSGSAMSAIEPTKVVQNVMVASPPVIWSEIDGESPLWAHRRKKFAIATSWMSTGLKFLVGFIGVLLCIKIAFSYLAYQSLSADTSNNPSLVDQNAEEKLIIQEYFQETGYRASSRAEVEKLRAEEKLLEAERQKTLQEERAQEAREKEYAQFVEESRRFGEQVSQNLRYEEEMQHRREEELRQQELYQKQMEQEQEQERIENEKRRWREELLNR